jgi:hypothetical protein
MIVGYSTPDELKRLPLRAIAALAARCARRVQHLARLPDDRPEKERCLSAVDEAIRLAEDFAKGLPVPRVEAVVREVEACRTLAQGQYARETAVAAIVLAAHAAATAQHALELEGESESESEEPHLFRNAEPSPLPHLADLTADLAARDAFVAGMDAAGAAGHSDGFIEAAREDYQKLLRLFLGTYPQAGQPIDPPPDGPPGPL